MLFLEKSTFKKENLSMKNTAEFKMLDDRDKRILALKETIKHLEKERDFLFYEISMEKEPSLIFEEELIKLRESDD